MEINGYDSFLEIGRGASSIVYRARQLAFDRVVALKVVSSAGIDEDARKRFDRECRAIGNLSWHPRVVPVYDAGLTGTGQPYLVMAYLEGGTLADRVRGEGPQRERDVLQVGVQVADALAAAHAVGVLHRDVKPGNVLVGHFGDAILADFGIASLTSAQTSVAGSLIGTLAFMAPELLAGSRASEASDVYSLGSTLFTLLTGRAAFVAATGESLIGSLLRAANEPLPDLRFEDVSDGLATVIERAMAKEPEARIPTAAALVEALQVAAVARGLEREPTYSDRAPTAATGPRRPAPSAGLPPMSLSLPPVRGSRSGASGAPADPRRPDSLGDAARAGKAPASKDGGDAGAEGLVSRVPVVHRETGSRPGQPDDADRGKEIDTVDHSTGVIPAASEAPPSGGGPVPASSDLAKGSEPEPAAKAGAGRRAWTIAAAAILLIAALVGGTALTLGGGDGDEDAGPVTSTTVATTTTEVTTTTREVTTTTQPPVASPGDITTANPAGSYDGVAKSVECDGIEATMCSSQAPTSVSITCPNTGCVLRLYWPEEIEIPLQFDGARHVGRLAGLDLGWHCTDESEPMLSTMEFSLQTHDAQFSDDQWRSVTLGGTYTMSNAAEYDCRGTTLRFDVLYQRLV